jgi:lipopolysaccharide assembly outer membrane protein LptD (OstA)
MKKVIKLILFLLLIIISIIFYKIYLSENTKSKIEVDTPEEEQAANPENNLIKNLKYEVKLNKNNQYVITSDLSEITYVGGNEVVKMQKVIAILSNQKNIPLIITSELATYNNFNYNTKFSQNVRVEYLNNIILSDKLEFDYNNSLITIYENVEYDGIQGNIIADNIKIDLLTKKIEIYMSNTNDNVEVTAKK